MSSTLVRLADVIPFSWVDGPGNRFVVFTQGCTFDCIACHNPSTIPRCTSATAPRRATVRDLLREIREAAPYLSGVTVSGGEATLQPRFVRTLFWAIKDDPELAHLTTFVDSNGDCPLRVWDSLRRVMDGAMLDLTALDPQVHRVLTGRPNDQVLASIRHLSALQRLYEVRLLIVPGYNDEPRQLRATGLWLHDVDPHVRTRLLAFSPHGVRPAFRAIPEPTADSMDELAHVLRFAGLTDVEVVARACSR